MDAKSKASFINSVADGAVVPCPQCGMSNKKENRFCFSCGSKIDDPERKEPIFEEKSAAVSGKPVTAVGNPAFLQVNSAPAQETTEKTSSRDECSVFAEGLPEWTVEPPQMMVRRR